MRLKPGMHLGLGDSVLTGQVQMHCVPSCMTCCGAGAHQVMDVLVPGKLVPNFICEGENSVIGQVR